MLILTRREGEGVTLDHGRIHLRIVALSDHRCTLGFTADGDCDILRDELVELQQVNQEFAAQAATTDATAWVPPASPGALEEDPLPAGGDS